MLLLAGTGKKISKTVPSHSHSHLRVNSRLSAVPTLFCV